MFDSFARQTHTQSLFIYVTAQTQTLKEPKMAAPRVVFSCLVLDVDF